MNPYIYAFLVVGALFGACSYQQRHLFSEGPQKPATDDASLGGRVFWTLVCTFLWPLMLVTGLNSAWILARRRSGSRAASR